MRKSLGIQDYTDLAGSLMFTKSKSSSARATNTHASVDSAMHVSIDARKPHIHLQLNR